MYNDPTAPADGPPPRAVEPWTRVIGHQVFTSSNGVSFCECGERRRHDIEQIPQEWRALHLREAWPVLVPRAQSEPLEDWMARISERYVAASQVELEIAEASGIGKPVLPGERIPVMTEEYMAASDLVEVLRHQLDEVRAHLIDRSGMYL